MRPNEFRLLIGVLSLLSAPCLASAAAAADGDLLDAVSDDDALGLRTLLASGADPNVRGAIGATPLMHAAALSSIDTLRALLDRGADVNRFSSNGASAFRATTKLFL